MRVSPPTDSLVGIVITIRMQRWQCRMVSKRSTSHCNVHRRHSTKPYRVEGTVRHGCSDSNNAWSREVCTRL